MHHKSTALQGNFWADPHERDLFVYTPPAYDESCSLPVVMVLPAFAGSAEGLLARGLSDISIATRFDLLIASGCPPFIGVLPDTMTTIGGSQYVNSPAVGDYENYLVDEIIPFVNTSMATNERWAVLGRSSGGYGSLRLAMNRPGTFRAVGSLAGDLGFDLCYLGDIPKALVGVSAAGGIENFLDVFWSRQRPSSAEFAAFNIIGMSCAYSPDLQRRPIPARFPVDFQTGEIDFEVFRSWQAFDPLVQVKDARAQDALGALDCLFLDAGNRDEYNLQFGARRMTQLLQESGIAHIYDEFAGGHRGTSYRYDHAIPLLVKAIS